MTLKSSNIQNDFKIPRTIKKPAPSKVPFRLERQGPTPPVPKSPKVNHPLLITKQNNIHESNGVSKTNGISAFDKAKMIARSITSLYEGGGVTGDFDNQGLSLGYLQWNIGSGTLQPLLKHMADGGNTSKIFDKIFEENVETEDDNGNMVTGKMSEILRDVLEKDLPSQIKWAKSINNNNEIINPWKKAFNKLLNNREFIKIQDNYAKPYLESAKNIINDKDFGVKTIRGYALAFDIVVQNGSIKSSAKKLIKEALEGKRNMLTDYNNPALTENQKFVVNELNKRLEKTTDNNLRKMYYTAAAVAISSKDEFIKDVWGRKSTIISGTGRVHGMNLDFNKRLGLNDYIS